MAFPQTKTPLSLTVRKRQRRINSSAVPLLLPVQSPAPQCASNNARPVITGACRSRLLGRIHRPFSRKARRGSSHGRPALPCTIRQLSAAFFPGTLSRHSRIFHCHGVYSSAGSKSRKTTLLVFHPAHAKSEAGSCNGCFVVPCGDSPLPCRCHGDIFRCACRRELLLPGCGGASGNRGAAGDERYRCIGSVSGEWQQALRGHFCFSLSFPQGKTMVY